MSLTITPHLHIAAAGLLQLEKKILANQAEIESWFRQQWLETPPPFYCSVDLRNAGFKVAPVDTNLFPAGFNNLNPQSLPLCVQAVQNTLEDISYDCKRIVLITESHSRNIFYMENVAVIQKILNQAGYSVRVGVFAEALEKETIINLPSGQNLKIEPIFREKNRIYLSGDFSPCIIILNHDLSEGIPEILKGIEQQIYPPLQLGWATRLKSNHFSHYEIIANEFANLVQIDPWLINPYYRRCTDVDFMTREGEECLVHHVEELIGLVQKKYDEYNINKKPFIVIKADAGTYGIGVMMVDSPKKIFELNRKQRQKMAKSKGGKLIDKVIVQEGVYSFETVNEQVAEPVIYMIGRHVIGGFYRVHTQKGPDENLNAPGMHFQPLPFAEPCNMPDFISANECCANRFYSYGVIARLALLAAAKEEATLVKE